MESNTIGGTYELHDMFQVRNEGYYAVLSCLKEKSNSADERIEAKWSLRLMHLPVLIQGASKLWYKVGYLC